MAADEPGLPSVSVIIPAFNAARTLAATLDSVAAQTLQPVEVFVVDDASTDETAELARSYRDRLPQLEVLQVAHGGTNPRRNIGVTRNTGIRRATGTLVAPLDGDDLWHPAYLEKMVRRYREAPEEPALVYCASRRVDLDGRVLSNIPVNNVQGPGFYRMLQRNFVGNGSSMIFSRRRGAALGLYDDRAANEDIHLQLKLAWHGPVAGVAEYLVGYRDVPGSVSKRFRKMAADLITMYDDLQRDFPQIAPEALRLGRAQAHVHMAKVHLLHGDGERSKAPYHLARGLLYEPVYLPSRTVAVAARWLRDRFRKVPHSAARPDFLSLDPALGVEFETRFGPRFERWGELDARHVFPALPEFGGARP